MSVMKFIYSMNKEVSRDLESAGLEKLGRCMINGGEVEVFLNSKEIYINKYQKSSVILSNRLFFDVIEDIKSKDNVED